MNDWLVSAGFLILAVAMSAAIFFAFFYGDD